MRQVLRHQVMQVDAREAHHPTHQMDPSRVSQELVPPVLPLWIPSHDYSEGSEVWVWMT